MTLAYQLEETAPHATRTLWQNAVRHIRRDGNDAVKKLEKDKAISQDDEHRAYDEIQKKTEKMCAELDDIVSHKDAELKEV